MSFIVNVVVPLMLFVGFISYGIKVYFHFLYLKVIKKYPEQLSYLKFLGSVNSSFFIDRIEIITPYLKIRKKNNLSDFEIKKAIVIEKRIKICLIIALIGFAAIPLGIYLQGRLN